MAIYIYTLYYDSSRQMFCMYVLSLYFLCREDIGTSFAIEQPERISFNSREAAKRSIFLYLCTYDNIHAQYTIKRKKGESN